ncbi:MAG: SIMPL domain-containing protein, partial [Oscillospiraceae bacterium]|nr:SIMPL domain-containing protein [Oscillospiraceae bacterium]
TLSLEGTCPEYGETLRRSSEDTERIKDLLSGFGFERSDLKTLSFNVDTEYEGYTENNVYKQRFVGYRFRHHMKVEFESDNDRLGKVLYALANSSLKPEFRLSYTVKDPEAAKNELLGKAIADAKEKALVLTKAAGVELKEIRSINYSWGEINFEVRPMNRMLMAKESDAPLMTGAGSYDMDIEPDDIEVSDTVTVLWEIR